MTVINSQITAWEGDFGDAYTERNMATEERVKQACAAFTEILSLTDGAQPQSILEIGANIGINLRALKRCTSASLFAVEPNAKAREVLVSDDVLPEECVYNGTTTNMHFADASIDLVFTSGVLIHVPTEDLEKSYREIYRVANRYILSLEYFSPQPTTIQYRGHEDMLFKRDYGGLWMDMFDDLQPAGYGFFWKRLSGLDDVNWWLFRKPSPD